MTPLDTSTYVGHWTRWEGRLVFQDNALYHSVLRKLSKSLPAGRQGKALYKVGVWNLSPGVYLGHLLRGLDDDEVCGQVDPEGEGAGAGQHCQVVLGEQLLYGVPVTRLQSSLHISPVTENSSQRGAVNKVANQRKV